LLFLVNDITSSGLTLLVVSLIESRALTSPIKGIDDDDTIDPLHPTIMALLPEFKLFMQSKHSNDDDASDDRDDSSAHFTDYVAFVLARNAKLSVASSTALMQEIMHMVRFYFNCPLFLSSNISYHRSIIYSC
jgi:hypothetical protein